MCIMSILGLIQKISFSQIVNNDICISVWSARWLSNKWSGLELKSQLSKWGKQYYYNDQFEDILLHRCNVLFVVCLFHLYSPVTRKRLWRYVLDKCAVRTRLGVVVVCPMRVGVDQADQITRS